MSEIHPKILIVEDEPDIASTLQSYLGRRGFQVSTTASGLEALSLIEISKPDVVILDFSLNDLNGQEVLKRLREKDQQTRIVVITGQMLPEEEIQRVRRLGIEEYFNKPIILEKLGEVIGRLTGHDITIKHDIRRASTSEFIHPEESFPRKDFHKLINLLGIIRNKCENFTLSMDEGIYKDKSEQDLLEMSDDIMRSVTENVDDALDVIDRIRKQE